MSFRIAQRERERERERERKREREREREREGEREVGGGSFINQDRKSLGPIGSAC